MWRIVLLAQGASFERLYNGLDTRADALLVGVALGVWLMLSPSPAREGTRVAGVLRYAAFSPRPRMPVPIPPPLPL